MLATFPIIVALSISAISASVLVYPRLRIWMEWLASLLLLCAVLIVAQKSLVWPSDDKVLVRSMNGNVRAHPPIMSPTFVNPFEHMDPMNVGPQVMDFSGDNAVIIGAVDGQSLRVSVKIPYRLEPWAAPTIRAMLGNEGIYQARLERLGRIATLSAISRYEKTDDSTLPIGDLITEIDYEFRRRLSAALFELGLSNVEASTAFEVSQPEILSLSFFEVESANVPVD